MTRNFFVAATALVVALGTTAPLPAQERPAGSNLGNVQGGDFKAARGIIAQKCTRCHSSQRIDKALTASKDMPRIQHEMEKRGAKLSANEREVLGIYWTQNPLKQKK